ncbi:DUF6415 family natural product biosynthesis protein [Streptomyces sp. NPDC047009]|uniref:DUF6415 family natural product biosynthesis protein n=1 Tax=Streptomyces sp. NPDC047009 TaxID=3154496 RepID=UPI0033C8A75B
MTGPVETESGTQPLDIATMRQTIGRLLPPDVEPLDTSEVDTLTALLRGHMELVIPAVHAVVQTLPKDDVPRYCALACIDEARGRLGRVAAGPARHDRLVYARRLARSLNALCDHYEALTGVRMCLVCDQPIRAGEATRLYDKVSPPSDAAGEGRIHERCGNSVRRR